MKLKIISTINSVLLAFCFTFLTFMLFKLNILPVKYFAIITILMFGVVVLILHSLISIKTKPKKKIIVNIISFIISLGLIFITSYINTTYNFINNLVSKEYEYKNYDVIVNNTSSYNDIYDLEDKKISSLENDEYYMELKEQINEDIEFLEEKVDVAFLTDGILNNKTDAIVLEDSYYTLLKDEYENLNNTKIIAKYKVKVEKKKNVDSVDIKTKPFILYISGIDTYGSISTTSRSDVNMLAVISPKEGKILLVSIPRDYYVTLNSIGYKDKLTHAGIYGIDMSMKTIEDLLDININYYVRLNFSTLTKSIDLLDGIDVYSDRTFTPWTNKNLTIYQGVNHMDGKMALAFARERKIYETGDRHRGENQQAIITAMIQKMTNLKYLLKYKEILNSLNNTFETNMSYDEITNLFKMQIDKQIKWDIESISLNGTGSYASTYSMGSRKLYVMQPDFSTVTSAHNKIVNLTK